MQVNVIVLHNLASNVVALRWDMQQSVLGLLGEILLFFIWFLTRLCRIQVSEAQGQLPLHGLDQLLNMAQFHRRCRRRLHRLRR